MQIDDSRIPVIGGAGFIVSSFIKNAFLNFDPKDIKKIQ